jgi:lipopolysaccharide exporter
MSERQSGVDTTSSTSARGSLGSSALAGFFWAYGSQFITQALAFGRNLVLARILVPEHFGIVAIASSGLALVNIMSDSGINRALIQRDDIEDADLNTGWMIQVTRGSLIALVIYLLANPTSNYYETTAAAGALRWFALAALITGFRNIGLIVLNRRLLFKRLFVLNASAETLATTVSVAFAFTIGDERAILWGIISAELVKSVGSYFVSDYRPRPRFNRVRASSLLKFGVWIYLAGFMVFVTRQGHALVIPKFLTLENLGHYAFATLIVLAVSRLLGVAFQKVLFPLLASIKSDPAKVRSVYLRAVGAIAIPATLLFSLLYLFSDPFINSFFGEQWVPAIGPMRILAISSFIKVIFEPMGTLLNALGMPRLSFTMAIVRGLALAVLIVPCLLIWGLEGAAYATLASTIGGSVLGTYYLNKHISIRYLDYFQVTILPIGAAVVSTMAVLALRRVEISDWLEIVLGVPVAVAVFFVSLWLVEGVPIGRKNRPLRSTIVSLRQKLQQ